MIGGIPLEDKVLELLIGGIKEVKEGLAAVHRRLDEMKIKDFVTVERCEGYRSSCKRGGVAGWVTILISVTSALVTGLLMYTYTSAQYLKRMQELIEHLGK